MRILFAGDSITEGWVQADPALFETRDWIGTGVGGDSTRQVRDRLCEDLPRYRPDVVHILAGINDIAGNDGSTDVNAIERRIVNMIDLCRSNDAKSVIGTLLPCTRIPWRPALLPNPMIDDLSRRIRSLAQAAVDIRCVDYHAAFQRSDMERLTYDGLHPNRQGYEVMSHAFLKAVCDL